MNLPYEIFSKTLKYFSETDEKELLSALKVTAEGLSFTEAKERLQAYGANTIREEKKLHIFLQFISGFKNPLVIILFLVSLVMFFTGSANNGFIVIAMIVLSVVLNFFQEYKASRAAEELKNKISTMCDVVRERSRHETPASQLCVGDIIEFNSGDLVPADCRVLNAKDFFLNQSSLTGESFPVEKHPGAPSVKSESDLAFPNIVYSGTNVTSGSAVCVVVKTGENSEFGKLARSMATEPDENEFTRGVNVFSVFILKIIIFFVLFIFLVNSWIRHDVLESLAFSVAIAVGLTPEFLPMIMSVNMGRGSVAMAAKGVIVKKLTAIPTFGSMDILCTDKTGTLTQDHIKLVKYTDCEGGHSERVFNFAFLNSYFQTGISNPMDDAVVSYKKVDVSGYKKVDEIPFDFIRRRMSVVIEGGGEKTLVTKGAPEEVLKVCKYYDCKGSSSPLTAEAGERLMGQYAGLSNEGFRVLAVAKKAVNGHRDVFTKEDENDMEIIGFTSFLDPPKIDARDAIIQLENSGIEIKVVTGDNELVAQKICREVGIDIKGVMLSSEIKEMSDIQLMHRVKDTTIFSRFTPDEKSRVIKALKTNNHVVGYMGDGINDALSLKTADVGISVNNAVDIAKESADIILTRKSLHLLVDGVAEGRRTFGNTMKYIMMGVSSNFGNMFSVLGAVLFLPFLPMLPIQILLNNFLYDFAQITIPSDNVDAEFLSKPKRWNIGFIRNYMAIFGPISSFYDYLTFFVLYLVFRYNGADFQTGWFMESLATQTLVIHVVRTRKIPFIQSKPSVWLTLTTILFVLVGWLIPYTPLGKFFGLSPLNTGTLIVLAGIVILYMLTVEFGKRLFYKKFSAASY